MNLDWLNLFIKIEFLLSIQIINVQPEKYPKNRRSFRTVSNQGAQAKTALSSVKKKENNLKKYDLAPSPPFPAFQIHNLQQFGHFYCPG